ncbi:MAG: inositol monophosphatase [Saprospiraceae bacterium]|nr:inositol monophosphatase [Saprospiraceae bacterium]
MTKDQFEAMTSATIPVVRKAADFIRSQAGTVSTEQIEAKALNSLVSYVDRSAEEILVEGLGAILPDATFLTEEDTVDNTDSSLVWIIDPLDGTTNFLHNLPFYSVSVALQSQGELVIGIVLEVTREELFYCWKGGGAFLNHQSIHVSSNRSFEEAVIATGFPYQDLNQLDAYMNVFRSFVKNARGVRRLGSAALNLAFVAAGRFDGFYEFNLNPWDISAGGLLIKEAGGLVEGFYDTDGWESGNSIIGSSPTIFHRMKGIINEYMPQNF